ncbi:MAG: hypothetical protein AAGC84_18965, partial [Pseudomonas sp.]
WFAYIKGVALVGLLGLSGCATNPAQKPITDGVFASPPGASTVHEVVGGSDKTVVVFISENTKANVEYLKQKKSDKEDAAVLRALGQGATLDAYSQALDPSFALNWMAKKLKGKFGKVVLVSDPAKLAAARYDYLIVLDAVFLTTGWGRDNATASFTTQFYDAKQLHISDIRGYRDTQVRSGASGPHGVDLFRANHQVRVDALTQWEAALDGLVKQPTLASSPSGASADACVQAALAVQNTALRRQAIAACN